MNSRERSRRVATGVPGILRGLRKAERAAIRRYGQRDRERDIRQRDDPAPPREARPHEEIIRPPTPRCKLREPS